MAIHPHLQYKVYREDESKTINGFSTHIPTLGLQATAIDTYRTASVHSIENKPDLWSLTDTEGMAALGRIIDGPIHSYQDFEHAENALRAILLHEYTQILVPCIKNANNNFVSYIRLDKKERNDASFELMQSIPSRDLLVASEYIESENGLIISSTNANTNLLNKNLNEISNYYKNLSFDAKDIIHTLPILFGASSYYSLESFKTNYDHETNHFIGEMYKRIYPNWMEIAQSSGSLENMQLPPFLSIVLSRTNLRSDIPNTIHELRMELNEVRKELYTLNEMFDKTMSQSELSAQLKYINQSFDAIIPEALLTPKKRRNRNFMSWINFIRPLPQLFAIANDPSSLNPDSLKQAFESIESIIATDNRVISRTMTSAKFSELMRVDSIPLTIKTIFTEHELNLLKTSYAESLR